MMKGRRASDVTVVETAPFDKMLSVKIEKNFQQKLRVAAAMQCKPVSYLVRDILVGYLNEHPVAMSPSVSHVLKKIEATETAV